MRSISNIPGESFRSEVENADFSALKADLVSVYGGTLIGETWVINGVPYTQGTSFNYFDADAYAEDSPSGWNRKLAIAGSDMTFDARGIPTSGNIEAIFFMNSHERILMGVDQMEGVSAADFYAAWVSSSTADDKAFFNSLFDSSVPPDDAGDADDAPGAVISGTRGANRLTGGNKDDILNGKGGNDTLDGRGGDDTLIGGAGRDKLLGQRGDDTLDGGYHADTLKGGAGKDTLAGGRGNDTLFGNTGNDDLDGGAGKDTLRGGAGRDILDGGADNDLLIGGKGGDTFVFGGGADRVRDFDTDQAGEVIDLGDAYGINNFRDLISNHAADTRSGVLITDDAGNSLFLRGLETSDLQADDFLF